jgi:hypothetical protein
MVRRNGTVSIKLDRKTAKALEAQAKARGMTLKDYLDELAGNGRKAHGGAGAITNAEELEKALNELFAAYPDDAPGLPADFSRADIYHDHD